MPRKRNSPKDRKRADERFRQDIERIRRAKGLPPLEPTPEPEQEPARPTPRPAPPRPPESRICIACRRERMAFGPPESSLICARCTGRGVDMDDVYSGRTLPPIKLAIPGMD